MAEQMESLTSISPADGLGVGFNESVFDPVEESLQAKIDPFCSEGTDEKHGA